MDNIMQYIPLAVSAVLLAALILTVVTNIITQVLKKLTWEKIPTNILAFLVAMAVTLLAFFAACQIMAWAVTWYMVAGAVALGLFVAYAAMFGYDKLREALEQIINWEKRKNRVKMSPGYHTYRCGSRGIFHYTRNSENNYCGAGKYWVS